MKLFTTIAAVTLMAVSAFASDFEENYGLSVDKAGSTLTIQSGDGMVHVCGAPMFPAGTYNYTLTGDSLNLKANTDTGLDFAYVSGGRHTVEGTWNIVDEDEGIEVTLVVGSSSLKVLSTCE